MYFSHIIAFILIVSLIYILMLRHTLQKKNDSIEDNAKKVAELRGYLLNNHSLWTLVAHLVGSQNLTKYDFKDTGLTQFAGGCGSKAKHIAIQRIVFLRQLSFEDLRKSKQPGFYFCREIFPEAMLLMTIDDDGNLSAAILRKGHGWHETSYHHGFHNDLWDQAHDAAALAAV